MKNKKQFGIWGSIFLVLSILAAILFFVQSPNAPVTEKMPEFTAIIKQTPTPLPTVQPSPDYTPIPTEQKTPPTSQPATPEPTAAPSPTPTATPGTVCSIAVHCQNALAPDSGLDQSIREVLPSDGVILQAENIAYQEGDSAFDVLSRELKQRNILFEFNENPMFNSVYMEGINHLYEFDCGSQSGWLYFINGKSPGTGCSQYVVQPGDYIEFIYTCNFGNDIL